MGFLYGDSTPSPLQVNFIELLRDVLECGVQVLQADDRLAEARRRARASEAAAATEIDSIRSLQAAVGEALGDSPPNAGESPRGRCLASILASVDSLVKAEVAHVQGGLAADLAAVEAHAATERDLCLKALEALLLRHELPDSTVTQHLSAVAGARYGCRAQLTTASGLEAALELDIPADSLFAQVVRVDRVAERLEVQAPEVGGWLHKEVKVRSQRLEKLFVTELLIGPDGRRVGLRIDPEATGPGFDLELRRQEPGVSLRRVDREAAAPAPFQVGEGDAARLRAFFDKLTAAAAPLNHHRKALLSARLDGEPLTSPETCVQVVSRLVAAVAPVAQEIAARSRSPGELVLRRMTGEDRREEIFVSKANLQAKLEGLGPARRALFDALWQDRTSLATNGVSRRPTPWDPPARILTPTFGSPLPGPGPGSVDVPTTEASAPTEDLGAGDSVPPTS